MVPLKLSKHYFLYESGGMKLQLRLAGDEKEPADSRQLFQRRL